MCGGCYVYIVYYESTLKHFPNQKRGSILFLNILKQVLRYLCGENEGNLVHFCLQLHKTHADKICRSAVDRKDLSILRLGWRGKLAPYL